jgi:hypothetical protein
MLAKVAQKREPHNKKASRVDPQEAFVFCVAGY